MSVNEDASLRLDRCADARPGGAETRLGRLRQVYFRAVDSWIPERLQESGGEALRRSRIVVGFTLVLLGLGLEAISFFHWALPSGATLGLDLALVAGLALTLLIPVALRRFDSIEPAANLIVGASYLVLGTVFVTLGGIHAPVLHWCALVPMLAVLMGSERSAWIWGGIALTTVFGFAAAEFLGAPPMGYLAESGLAGEKLWLQRLIDVGSWIGILFVIGLIFERHKDQQTAELSATNLELKGEMAQRRRAEQRTRFLAYHDELTSLPNRQFFTEQLERAMEEAAGEGRMVAVMFLDLDSFKEVNDTFGHRLGDRLLQGVAERLRSCVRNADGVFHGAGPAEREEAEPGDSSAVVSRLGGDEFTVLLVRLRSEEEASIVACRILACFESPFHLEDNEIYISASIGIALYPRDVMDVNELLKSADIAMYDAKARGKNNYQFFTQSMNDEIVHRTTIVAELRKALVRDELVLYYQPIFDARSRAVVGVEALLRWQHPTRGLLAPGEFIAVAEESGLIIPISEQVLLRACRQNVAWQERGLPPVRIAVNISGVELRHARLSEFVAQVLLETELQAKFLELEITESAVMADEVESGKTLKLLKEQGVSISLDDFGTGYSSLSYARRYPVDTLKIDRSFVSGVGTDPDAQAITTAIVAMAHGLNLKVVAEGVETAEQEEFLVGLGCDALQGFRLGRPVPCEELTRLLERTS